MCSSALIQNYVDPGSCRIRMPNDVIRFQPAGTAIPYGGPPRREFIFVLVALLIATAIYIFGTFYRFTAVSELNVTCDEVVTVHL